MNVPLKHRPRRQIRVVLSSTALLSFMTVRKAAALAIAQLGVAAFFVAGTARAAIGESAAWFVLAAAIVGVFVRAVDIESWALLVPGGVVARVHQAFGVRAAKAAAAANLVERLLLAALACILIGQYASTVTLTAIAGWRLTGYVRPEDFATIAAVSVAGLLWIRARIGRDMTTDRIAQRRVDCGGDSVGPDRLGRHHRGASSPVLEHADACRRCRSAAAAGVRSIWRSPTSLGFGLALPAIGGGDAVARAAHELRPPRLQALQPHERPGDDVHDRRDRVVCVSLHRAGAERRSAALDERAARRAGAPACGARLGDRLHGARARRGRGAAPAAGGEPRHDATPSSSCSGCRSRAPFPSAWRSCTRGSARHPGPSTSPWPRRCS